MLSASTMHLLSQVSLRQDAMFINNMSYIALQNYPLKVHIWELFRNSSKNLHCVSTKSKDRKLLILNCDKLFSNWNKLARSKPQVSH